ncbi:MAG TPA: FAD binding domain-containing protein [Vicinamibacterales bacterium]|nr:FAD binding domain-containing protein [Vicinamibacterales bacterium]
MRGYLPAYELRVASRLGDALALLASEPGRWRPFAGGTDLMVQLESGALPEGRYLGLWKLPELRGIRDASNEIAIGALTTYTDILASEHVRREFPMLCEAARETGGVATQNRGTIGGNIANASPAADTSPVLIVYDAELELISTRGARRVRYDAFHHGYKKMDLRPDELIARVLLPRRAGPEGPAYVGRGFSPAELGWREHYRKVGTRKAQAISKVCFAGAISTNAAMGVIRVDDVRIALGSVAPTVVRARAAEAALRGRILDRPLIAAAEHALAGDISPIDDLRSTAHYRRRVATRLLRNWLDGLTASISA